MDIPFGLRTLGQVHLLVDDLPRAISCYRDVLGAALLFDVPGMRFFSLGDVRLMLGRREDSSPAGASILYFTVEHIQSATDELSGRGISFTLAPTRIAEMRDHDLWMSFFKVSQDNGLALMSEVPHDP